MQRKPGVILFRPAASRFFRQGEAPVQLLAIARMLLDKYDVRLVVAELGLDRKAPAQLEKEIDEHLDGCLFFGVTAMTGYGIGEALALSRFVRARSPETKIVWGGWHASLLPEQTLREAEIDFAVIGQGEHTAVELAEAIAAGETDFSRILGLAWKKDGAIVVNPARPVADINSFPPIPYHLLEDKAFDQKPDERSIGFLTSVGCPFDCGFCADRAVYGGKWKRLRVERAIEELRALKENYGVTGVRILDSNFFVDWSRGTGILRGMREMGMRAIWVNAGINTLLKARYEDFELFRQTVDSFLVGAESGSEDTLDLISKLQTVEDIREVGRRYAENGISICFSTLVGVPFDDPEEWKKEFSLTIKMLDEILTVSKFLHTAQVHIYTPYPGTPLFPRAVAKGFDPPQTLLGWSDVELFTSKLPYLPPHLGEMTEFLSAYVLQLMRPGYQFYRGANPFVKVSFAAAQAILKVVFRLRWRLKYFRHPIEMRLIQRVLSQPAG